MDKDKIRIVNPIIKKKHIQVLEECERMLRHNHEYCIKNNCDPSEYMLGENEVLENLIAFINKL